MSEFDPLLRELDRWGEAGRSATWWWRDDDAAQPSLALDQLLHLSDAPLALAVVPAATDEALAARLAPIPQVAVLQHGYAHQNHAGTKEKKIELGPQRPAQIVIGELATGKLRLEQLFSAKALPVLVPPWNRIAPALVPVLPELGYRGLSQFAPRARAKPVRGLVQSNCHLDLIDWQSRRFIGAEAAISALVKHLALRYAGAASQPDVAGEPSGVMSHHAVHHKEAWAFLERLLAVLTAHQAAPALSAVEVFAL
ncbi:MAG: polysaccharide deacetylase family protein [Rhodospirillales bacterium]